MPEIRPFTGYRYNDELMKTQLEKLITPPYDIINEEMQKKFYEIHPNNFVRLILPIEEDRYNSAKNTLERWLEENIIIREKKQSFYLYTQRFSINGKSYIRNTYITLLKVYDFKDGEVYPHERTKSKPKEDRFNLYTTTMTNLCPIFGLVNKEIEKPKKAIFLGEARDQDDIIHIISRIDDKDFESYFIDLLKESKVFIADGHHRYETSIRIRNQLSRGDDPPAYTLIGLTSFYDEGLIILPTHRIVKTEFKGDILTRIKSSFDIKETKKDSPEENEIILITKEKNYSLRLKDLSLLDPFIGEAEKNYSSTWKGLAVNILFYGILKPILNIDEIALREKDLIIYTPKVEEAKKHVKEHNYLAFILPPLKTEDFIEVSERIEYLPQKTTYFYPKLASGLVFRSLKEF